MSSTLPAINLADYSIEDCADDAEVLRRLRDPLFRICNLYRIKDPDGAEVKFVPNYPQRVVLYCIYVLGWNRLLIPKARQLGFSTLFAIVCLDETHFSEGKQASIVDQTQADAGEKLSKVRFAWERITPKLRDAVVKNNSKEIEWSNGSRVVGGMRARGGTNQVLHISEWGPIAFDDPERSREISTGAIPSASGETAKVFAESTHKGGKGGDWYMMIKRALETAENDRTAKDFRVLFFPWWMEPRYRTKGNSLQIDKDTIKYFAKLEQDQGISLDSEQRLFYYKEKSRLRNEIYREFPSTIDECWLAPTPGMIFAQEVDKARAQGRISDSVRWYEQFPVYTSWDIGAPENQKVWIFQVIGDRIIFLEALSGGDECRHPAHWSKRLKEKRYSYGGHFLPHDGEVLWRSQLVDAGLDGVVVMPRCVNVWDNINEGLGSFGRCEFALQSCAGGIDALEGYHAKVESDGNSVRDVPVHDWASHFSTAFCYAHQAIHLGLLRDRSAMPKRPARPQDIAPKSITGMRDEMSVAMARREALARVTVRR
jgi:hypothetical protein